MSKTWATLECESVRREARLVEEHRDEPLLLAEVRQDALDRDLLLEALDPGALGEEDLGHAARGEALDDAVSLLLVGFRHAYLPVLDLGCGVMVLSAGDGPGR